MGVCSQSSNYLKLAAVGGVVAVVLHIVGFATYSWSTVETEITLSGYLFQVTITYLIGLWKHCICLDLFGQDTCDCADISDPPGWLLATKGLCGLAITGMLIGGIMTFVSACSSTSNKQLKIGAAIMMAGSGVLLLAAIIVYGIESKKHLDAIFGSLDYIAGIDVYSLNKFGFSFILSTAAAVLCLVVCVPLIIYDLNLPPTPNNPTVAPVMYGNNQVHIIAVPQQGYGYGGSMQPAHSSMVPPPAYPGAPPPQGLYNQQYPPASAPMTHQAGGIPPKS